MTHVAILGIGEFRPEHVRTNDAWPESFGSARPQGNDELFTTVRPDESDACARIVHRHLAAEGHDVFVGTRERRIADDALGANEAQALAARAALADAKLDGGEIDFVLSHGYPTERPSIPSAPFVIQHLGIKGATGLEVGAACASMIAQMTLARALIASGQARYVLLTQAHLATRTMPMVHPASPNLGDLATAVVLGPSPEPGVLGTLSETHGEYANAVVWTRSPRATARPWWEEGGRFLLGSLDPKGTQELVGRTVQIARDTLLALCKSCDVAQADVGLLCSVQPRAWIPRAIAEALGVPEGRTPDTFRELAHVGACGPVANLLAARRNGQLARDTLVAFYAQGAGFTRTAALARWIPPG